jgi:hypothetical protein
MTKIHGLFNELKIDDKSGENYDMLKIPTKNSAMQTEPINILN